MNAPLRVLHLEDDDRDAKLIHAALVAEGIPIELTRVETEPDFVSALNRGSCDLILADYTLPSFDGLSAFRIAQRQLPDVPFIFVSGTLGEEVAIEALKTGATDYILKTRLSRLGPAVTRALREAREKAGRMEAEEALRRSQKELHAVIDAMPTFAWTALPDGSIDFANRYWVEFTGLSIEESLGLGWEAAVHPEDVGRNREKWHSSIETGDPFENEVRYRSANGQYRWFLGRAVPQRAARGKIVKWYGISTDVEDRKRAEEAMRRSEAYLAEAQRLSHTGSFAYNPGSGNVPYPGNGQTLYWSEELFRIFGFEPRQGGGAGPDDAYEIVHPDDRVRVSKECRAAFPKKVDFSQKYRLLLHDGTIKHIHVIWHPVLDQAGELVEYVGTVADVTEAVLLTQKLKQRETYLSEAQRLSHTGSFGWKPATDEHFWSDETFRIWEYDVSAKITLPLILDRIHPEDIPHAQQVIARAAENGQDIDLEYRLLMPTGFVKHIHVVARAVRANSGDIEFVGAAMDITERKQTQEALSAAKARFEGILEIAEDAIISMDSGQRIVLFNQGAERVFGYASTEVMGKSLDMLLPQRFAHSHRGHIEAFAKTPEVSRKMGQRREVFGRRKDGSEFPAEASISKLALGKEVVFTVILRDITERKRAEEALRRSEAYLAEAQKLTHTGSWVWNPSRAGVGLYWSQEMFRIHGADPEQPIPDWEAFQLVHPDDRDRVRELVTKAVRDKSPLAIGYRVVLADGTLKHLEVIGHPVLDEGGDFLEYIGTVADVTERKRAEQALQKSEQQWKDVFENNPTMYFMVKADGTILSVNPFGAEQLGYTVAELVGSPVMNIFHESDRIAVQEKIAGCLKQLGRSMRWEFRKVRKNGSILWVRETARAVMRDDLPIVLVACEDITERKHTEEALRRSETLLAEGQRISHTGSWVYKPATGELTSSKERFRIFGLDPEKIPSTTQVFSERVLPDDKPRLRKILDSAIREKSDFEFEYRIVTPDGVIKHVHTIAHAITNESGELVEFFGSTADITERKHNEEALRRSEAYLAKAQRLTHTGSWSRSPATGQFLYCSEEMLRIFDWNPQQGKPTVEILMQRVHPEDIKTVRQIIQEALRQKVDYTVDFRILLPGGTVKFIRNIGHPVLNADGEVVEYVGTSMDVTERKHAEEAIRRSEAFLAEGQRISHTGSWVWNPFTGEMTSSKERFLIFGLDPEKTKPSFDVFWERVHPEDKPRFKRVFDAAVREKTDFKIGYRIVTPDWVIKHIHSVGHAVVNESGELIEFIGSTMDITERKRAEERAQNHNEAVRLALNSFVEELDLNRFLGHVITGLTKQFQATTSELWLSEDSSSTAKLFVTCEQGKLVWADEREPTGLPPRATRFTRERPDIGRLPRIIELPAHKSLLRPAHLESLKHQDIKTVLLVPLVMGEQNLGFVELRFVEATRLTSDDVNLAQALVHHATLALQLSRLAHRTEQMAVMEERNRMAREIHDTLAQAFAGVVLHAEALGTSLERSKTRSRKSLLNIQKLARSGLEEARRSVQALRPKALEGSTLTQALAQEVKRLSADGKLSCEFKQEGEAVNFSVEIQNELFRIAQEAMTNVCKHAHAKSIWITLEFKANHAMLTVQDDGIGFAATHSPKPKGGYGLSSMRERAQRIGGQIEIKSPTSGGTAIRVLVPFTENEKPTSQTI